MRDKTLDDSIWRYVDINNKVAFNLFYVSGGLRHSNVLRTYVYNNTFAPVWYSVRDSVLRSICQHIRNHAR